MKLSKFILLVAPVFILMLFFSSTGAGQSNELKLQKVIERLYMISGGIGANAAFLVTEEGILVVDAKYFPYEGEEVVAKIRQVSSKPIKFLIYTHYHGDHTQGAQSFPPSTLIIAHSNTLKNMMKDGWSRIERDKTIHFPNQLKALEQKVKKLKEENSSELLQAEKDLELKRYQIKDYERVKLVYPDVTFQKKAVIYLGDQKVELLYMGRAHTDGDILVYFPAEKVIHMGDVLYFPGLEEKILNSKSILEAVSKMEAEEVMNLITDCENWIKILESAAEMDVEKVLDGHGNITDKTALITQANYLKDLLVEIRKVYPLGGFREESKKKLMQPKYQKLAYY